jgi:hypothetical protein
MPFAPGAERARKLSSHDIRRLAVAAVCSEKTVRRWLLREDGVGESSRVRLERAQRELGVVVAGGAAA